MEAAMARAYSLSFLTCLDAPPPAAIRIAAETGYDFIGVRLLPALPGGVAFNLMEDAALFRETTAALADTGMSVFDVEMVRIAPGFSTERYKPFLETCARLGATAILVAGDDDDEARMTASFAAFCEAAHPYGLSADLEFMPQSKVRDAAAATRILTAASQPNGAIIVDALHVSRSHTPLADIRAIPRQWLNYAQICDGPADIPRDLDGLNYAARHERLLPGEGAIDLTALFSSLPADVPVSIEVPNAKRAPALGAREWAARALATSKTVLARVDERRAAAPRP
jgi:sugar phosphate isomerase/epimerase